MNRTIKFIFIFIAIPAFAIFSCKKKPQSIKGVVTFVKGKVEVIRQKGNIKQVKLKDIIKEGDDIRTGDKAFVVIQLSKMGIVRIEADSLLNFDRLFAKNVTELYLINGKILAKIIRTDTKKDKFFVKTPTAVAGLRGTVFSVEFYEGISSVAVKEGKIALSTANEFKETIITKGKTADVAEKVRIRKSTEFEKLDLEKIAHVKLLPETIKVKSEKFQDYQARILKDEKKISIKIEKLNKPLLLKSKKAKRAKPKKIRSLKEIKKQYQRVDKITLYNGKVIRGAIVKRGKFIQVITPKGAISLSKKEIKNIEIIR